MGSLSLYAMIVLTGTVFGAEIVSSHVTQSLTLLLSAYHMLYNFLSLLLLVISHRMSKEKTLKNTFGWARIKVLGMLFNMLFLCALCFAAAVECVQTVVHAAHENTEPRFPYLILAVGIINFSLNIISFFLIGGYTHHQGCSMIVLRNKDRGKCALVERGAGANTAWSIKKEQTLLSEGKWYSSVSGDHILMDLWRDLSSCLAVISCACVNLLLDGMILKYADAILAGASIAVLLFTTYPFLKESGLILLQSIPNNMDISGIATRLCGEFPAIENVHDLHIWQLTAAEVIATVHVIVSTPAVYVSMASKMKDFFEKEGISLVTIQPEFVKDTYSSKNGVCYLTCASSDKCGPLTCCGAGIRADATTPRLRKSCPQTEVEESCPFLNGNGVPNSDIGQTDPLNFDFQKLHSVVETNV